MAQKCATLSDAWRITADNVLASAYVQCQQEAQTDHQVDDDSSREAFQAASSTIRSASLPSRECERIHTWLVKAHGYQFARALIAKSSVKEHVAMAKASKQERRAQDRYGRAWSSTKLVADHGRYWKEVCSWTQNRLKS